MILADLKSVIAIVAVFVISITVHEFGHFIVAKKSGVAVPAFAIGFGPKIFRWERGGTEYSIRLFPIGGLVQLAGEMPQDALFRKGEQIAIQLDERGRVSRLGDPIDVPTGRVVTLIDLDLLTRLEITVDEGDGETRTYQLIPHAKLMTSARNSIPLVERHEQVLGKPLWQRAAMILAGPFMNFLLAGIMFSLYSFHSGVPQYGTATLGQIVPGSAAQTAGLKQGDRVLSVNNQPVSTWMQLVAQIKSDTTIPPAPLMLKIDRSGEQQVIKITPTRSGGRAILGVDPPTIHQPLQSVGSGFADVYRGTVNTIALYGQVISHHQFNDFSGPVGIASIISQQAQSGIWQVIFITGFLSLNLGLFNLFPIPALDGGRLLFMLVEAVRGKAIDPRKEGLVHMAGFAFMMLLLVVFTYKDVTRLF